MSSLIFGAVLVLLAAAGFYFLIFRRANPQLAIDQIKINNASFTVEVASGIFEKARGLSFRPDLADGYGMLFVFITKGTRAFWMKDMKFAIDLIWIGGDTVLGITENAKPESGSLFGHHLYTSPEGTNNVLEVPAGTAHKYSIKEGDKVIR